MNHNNLEIKKKTWELKPASPIIQYAVRAANASSRVIGI